jgi:hypothetical protein
VPFDHVAHRALGGAVGGGDGRQVELVVDRERGAKIRPDRRAGGVGEVGGKPEIGV